MDDANGFCFCWLQDRIRVVGGCGHDQKVCFRPTLHFLRTYGASPQVVAASMVLLQLYHCTCSTVPYQDEAHNYLESLGLHICLLQLLVTLMC